MKKLSFKDGNKVVKHYVDHAKDKIEEIGEKHDNIMGFVATMESKNGEEGKLYRFKSNVSVVDIASTLSNLADRDDEFKTAMIMAVNEMKEDNEDYDFSDLIKKLAKNGGNAKGVIKISGGKAKVMDVDDLEIQDDIKEILKMMGGKKGEPEMKVAEEEKPKEKKKIKIKDLLGGK